MVKIWICTYARPSSYIWYNLPSIVVFSTMHANALLYISHFSSAPVLQCSTTTQLCAACGLVQCRALISVTIQCTCTCRSMCGNCQWAVYTLSPEHCNVCGNVCKTNRGQKTFPRQHNLCVEHKYTVNVPKLFVTDCTVMSPTAFPPEPGHRDPIRKRPIKELINLCHPPRVHIISLITLTHITYS